MQEKMTSRERIIAAINHRETDRLPIDFGSMGSTGIHIMAYNKLKKYLNLDTGRNSRLEDIMQQLAVPEPEMIDRLGGDVINIVNPFYSYEDNREKWKPWQLRDGTDCEVPTGFNPVKNENGDLEIWHKGSREMVMTKSSLYFESVWTPCASIRTISDIEKHDFGSLPAEKIEKLGRQAEYLYKNTDKALLYSFGGSILERSLSDFGHERFFILMAEDPGFVHAWLRKLSAHYLEDLKRILSAIGPYIQIINFGDDLGTQQASQISPFMYKELIKPYHAAQFKLVREYFPEIKVFLHSCGAISELIPDLIDAGVNILNPVQISARAMQPEKLKHQFGKDITFWGGGVDTQHVLPSAGLEEIRENVRSLIDIFAPGGGYVFNPVHNIQADIEPEKILAVYDTARGYCR